MLNQDERFMDIHCFILLFYLFENFILRNFGKRLTDMKLHKPGMTAFWKEHEWVSEGPHLHWTPRRSTCSPSSPEQWSEIVICSRMYENLGRINVLPRVLKSLSGIIYSLAGLDWIIHVTTSVGMLIVWLLLVGLFPPKLSHLILPPLHEMFWGCIFFP